ncbi:hypothetical protein [Idiomarina abyssalis]|uniref:Uncharacterized protein n=1 Tax=Idiomarina abyssalis TaxID=86102 RepID=A0A8I1KHK6_9GAMM|nr:hypothetical protein [Idiomarina abyssalis]MBJ7265418.1 hypothetical protein [Idiomarina abyssalis]MBJ7316908.1 hypothetical protein [Idiomarina abyssalis]
MGYFRIAKAIEAFGFCLLVGLFAIATALADGVFQWIIACVAVLPTLAVVKGLFMSKDVEHEWMKSYIESELDTGSASRSHETTKD